MSTAENKLTMAGAVFGTPHYMSPEQAAGTPVDHRTDIYSLGVILYEMASGTLPFNADNFMAILSQQMYQAPTPIREIVAGCSLGLEAVILKCLSKKPEARYQSMEELGEELGRVKSGEVPLAVAEMMSRSEGFDVPPEYFKRSSVAVPGPARGRATLLYAASALAIVIGVLAVVFALKATAPQQPPAAPTAVATPSPPPVEPAPQPPASLAKTAEPPPSPKIVSVAPAATPETAEAFIDGKPVKLPTPIDVEEGKTVTFEVRAPGYETQQVTLDGKERSKLVKLNKIRGPGTVKTAIPGIVDPFDPKRRGQ